ncbi:MAG: hypothetical protein R3285_06220, partial [Kiloniellales bacterium]|nr:hypothetical protein [Kiloniellales bacterium]
MRHHFWTLVLIAGLALAWPTAVAAQQSPADDQARLDGALGFLEHFAVRRIIEAVGVDASQVTSFRHEPGTEPEVWTMTGTAAITDMGGDRGQYPYKAQLTILCDAYERTGCWDLQSLSLGQWVLSETSPTIVALAELGEAPATAADPPVGEASDGAVGQGQAETAEIRDDNGEDIALLRRRAEAGDAAAQYQLAEVYRRGFPLARDEAKALELYRLAAGQGHAAAQFRLGELYDEGALVARDPGKALEYYRLAAEQGHAGAQYALAHTYHLGRGVAQDMAAAMEWYGRAAEQGDEWSQLALGDQYRIGLAVPRDLAQSTAWYRRAAEQGNIFAQFELANAYRFGNGVEPDAAQALAWYRRSAEAGNPSAKLALAELETGTTVVASAVEVATATAGPATEPAVEEPREPTYSDEREISLLLEHAEDQMAKLALTTPEGDNAYETYQMILSLQPDNPAALAGIERIGVKYVELAARAAAKGDSVKARRYADKAADLAPENPLVQSWSLPAEPPPPRSEDARPATEALENSEPPPAPEILAQEFAEIEAAQSPTEAAPVEVAPVEVAPVEVVPVEVAPVEVARAEVAPAVPPSEPQPAGQDVEDLVYRPHTYAGRQVVVTGSVVHLMWDYRLKSETGQNSLVVNVDGLSPANRARLASAVERAGLLGQVRARIKGTVRRQTPATFELAASELTLIELAPEAGKAPDPSPAPDEAASPVAT